MYSSSKAISLLYTKSPDTGSVHKGKKELAEATFQTVSGNVPKASPVSWKLTLWHRRRPGKTNAEDGERSRPEPKLDLFQELILQQLDAAHNLARWLMHNEADAQDVVLESSLRAFRFFDSYQGGDSKAWLLAIVRNTCRTWQRRRNRETEAVAFDETAHSCEGCAPNQEQSVVQGERAGVLRSCIERLPADFREVLVMRELEEMSYQEIAAVTGLPIGTVMSRLSRARKRLKECASGSIIEAAQ